MMYADPVGNLVARVNADIVNLGLTGNHLIVVGKGIPIESAQGESKRLVIYEAEDDG